MRLPSRSSVEGLRHGPPVRLTPAELMALPEYSCSEPTGAQPGRRWRADANFFRRRRVAMLDPFGNLRGGVAAIGAEWELPYVRQIPEATTEEWWVAEVLPEVHPEGGFWIQFSPVVVAGVGER